MKHFLTTSNPENELTPLGEKIFLDRYAQKDMERNFQVGDVAIVCINKQTGQRDLGHVVSVHALSVEVEFEDGKRTWFPVNQVDRPLELSPEDVFDRVAESMAACESWDIRGQVTEAFRQVLEGWKFIPAGRILTTAGTNQNLTMNNCFVISPPHDSREGIMATLTEMTEIMSRGGGVGITLSSLRPRYSYVAGVNGRSSGSVSWGGLYSFVTGLVEQGGSRRGALLLLLDDWHPDLLEFIQAKKTMGQITNANTSVALSDEFMEAVENDSDWAFMFPDTKDPEYDVVWDGDLEKWKKSGRGVTSYKSMRARKIWEQITDSAWASAEPGIWFKGRANAQSNSHYFSKLIGLNPCLTGETLIHTSEGLVRIDKLAARGNSFQVAISQNKVGRDDLNDDMIWEATRAFSSGTKPVFVLDTKEGYSLRLTEDHKVFVRSKGWVEAKDLVAGDIIELQDIHKRMVPRSSQNMDSPFGRVLGWFVGDGYITGNRAALDFYGPKRELAEGFAADVESVVRASLNNRVYTVSPTTVPDRDLETINSFRLYEFLDKYGMIANKHCVPDIVLSGHTSTQADFLRALFSADGHIENTDKSRCLVLTSISMGLLRDVQRLLLYLGIYSNIYRDRHPAQTKLMANGKGGEKEYECQAVHGLHISGKDAVEFHRSIGFLLSDKQQALQKLVESYSRGPYKKQRTATFVSLTPGGEAEVFDITVPKIHAFVANGLVVHNCGEQNLPANSVCNLGSINLPKMLRRVGEDWSDNWEVDWELLMDTVKTAVRFLDNVIDTTQYPTAASRQQQAIERRIGLGTLGLGEMLIRLKIRYGSEDCVQFLDKLYQAIATRAYLASVELAQEKGRFPKFRTEEFLQSGYVQRLPKHVQNSIKAYGIRNVTLLTQPPTGTTGTLVNTSTGIEPFFYWEYERTVRLGTHTERVNVYEEWLLEHGREAALPPYFVTAMDLQPAEHIRVQACIQKWVDSAISKTCNVPADYTKDEVRSIYELMYATGCKGGTIYRDGSRDVQVLNIKEEEGRKSAWVEGWDANGAYAPKRPEKIEAELILFDENNGSGPLIAVVGLLEGRPYEVFAGPAHHFYIEVIFEDEHGNSDPEDHEYVYLDDLIRDRHIMSSEIWQEKDETGRNHYHLMVRLDGTPNEEWTHCFHDFSQHFNQEHEFLTRMVSLNLRHGINPAYTSEQLCHAKMGSFPHKLCKVLKKYVPEGTTQRSRHVPDCYCPPGESRIIHTEGCKQCLNCQWTKC